MKKKSIRRKSLGKGRRRITRRYSRIQRGGTLEESNDKMNSQIVVWELNPKGYDSPRAYHEDNELRPVHTWVNHK